MAMAKARGGTTTAGPGYRDALDGYVADSLYPSSFHAAFAPPNIDAILTHGGIASPRGAAPRGPFTMVDIGSGDGIGLILNAAAHPEGHFIGIDGNPAHIELGASIAAAGGLPNIRFEHAYFDAARGALPAATADYVQCQGVLAWVSEANRGHVLDLAGHLLKPGGVLAIGYNCLPGWTPIMAFQQMVRALAADRRGTPVERFEGALAALRAADVFGREHWEWIDGLRARYPADYFAHEYLNENWCPLWAGDVVTAAAARALACAGQARPYRLRPDLALKAAWRRSLDAIESAAARETATDLFTGNWFRTDPYVKGAVRRLTAKTRDEARMPGWWAATKPAGEARFEARTAAGTMGFDNAAAHAILATLADGPQPLSVVQGLGSADLLNAIDALFMAGEVIAVDPPASVPHASAVNAAIQAAGVGATVNGAITRHGAIERVRGSPSTPTDEQSRRLGF